ncbi:PIR protein CIR protein [Plasmodium vinckei vinckei]|uniref:PIR protein CIR protein n=1 Tax=Plasmodium vinckei vinckei TaxID=54757 RepID=A0A449BM75_PLAVN|nr:PIR protein CIR protein [Plasmodium vinckei vinckei]VEV54556.1 PIR protein CIR protein [Plasmodium vinckei vinckei]
MANEACKLLRKADAYFKNENVDVTKFDKSNLFTYKCPKKGEKYECTTNNERINALGVNLYQNIYKIANTLNGTGDNGNRHIEIFIMWLSDKLYKLEANKTQTLEESYKNNLEKHTGNYKYWNILDSKQSYKKANVWYMSELYRLLNCICNIVIEYKKKNKNKEKIENYSSQCYQEFNNVYNIVKNCYSYFHLLKFLKSIYDDIRNHAIKDANNKKEAIRKAFITNNTFKKAVSPHKANLGEAFEQILNGSTISLIDLTTSDWNQKFLDVSDKILDFHTQVCINSHSELMEEVKKQQELESKNQPKAPPQTQHLGSLPLLSQDQDSPSSQKGTPLQKPQEGEPNSQNEPKTLDNSKENTGGANDNKGNPNDGSNDSTSSDPATSTPGGNFYWGSLFNGSLFNRTEIFNKASQFIDKSRQTVKEVTDKISSAYTNAVDNLKSAYTVSNNYISGVVSSVTDKLSSFGTFQLSDDQSGSNSLGGGVDTSDPSQPKSPPPLQSLPSSPSDSQTRSDPPSQKSLGSQTSTTTIQQIAPTGGNIASQTPPSGQGTLSISGNNSSNTKNENLITMANVKMKEAPSIWCIGTNTKCDITRISIIVISIFAFLAIMYKYISLGCTSKSKRKKTIKKVINSIGGKRPVQIIIKSYDRNKDLKPVINSVGRKKDSLLNIYKLMQADPVPFINLFFLLIFFVYKKKINYLEL